MDEEELRRRYLEREPLLETARANVEGLLKEILDGVEHVDRASVRVKKIESFIEKALDPDRPKPYDDPLQEIEDQLAGRVIVFFLDDITIVRDRLLACFNRVEHVRKEPARDAEFSYESEHLIVAIPPLIKPPRWSDRDDLPVTMEFQIRTIFMHAYAEPEHELRYKSAHELPREIRRELAWVAASAWGADQALRRVFKWNREAKEEAERLRQRSNP